MRHPVKCSRAGRPPGRTGPPLLCASLLVAAAFAIASCGGDGSTEPPPPPPVAPQRAGMIPDQTIVTGQTTTLDVVSYFSDPDGGALTYTASSSAAAVVSVSVSGDTLTLEGIAEGTATVTVTATDPDGLTAAQGFQVTVESARSGFQIDLAFATPVTRTQQAAFVRAAARWMNVLAPTNLGDFQHLWWSCWDDQKFERYAAIDDVLIVAAVEEIDGQGGTVASAGPCWIRDEGGLPIYGGMTFDAADIDQFEQDGSLEELILHEMGHVLGIGTIWEDLGLLRDPASESEAPDTHFSGPLAIVAFDEAGGTDYEGAKVPVENTAGPGIWDGHWRETVLNAELMTAWTEEGVPEPMSAITIQSLADMGYAVDLTAAEPYRLPEADADQARESARLIHYGDDIWRVPMVVADPDGRIVRVIPGPRSDRSR